MKKKYILLFLPTLLALSSCGVKTPENKVPFEEDTTAHEELFGEAKPCLNVRRANELKAGNEAPMIGVQSHESNGNISIRFVAAINISDGNLAGTTVTWKRTMYKPDGFKYLDTADKESQKVYTSINNNGEVLTIEDFNTEKGTNYNYFAVYTMLNIPKATYSDYFLNAYVTLSGASSGTSKMYASKIDQEFGLTYDVNADSGYYLTGTIRGTKQTVYCRTIGKKDFVEYFNEGDTFYAFYKYRYNEGTELFQAWNGNDIKEGTSNLENHNGLIRMKQTGQMRVYIDNGEVTSNGHYEYYLMGSATGHDDMNQYLDYKFIDTQDNDNHSSVIGCFAALKHVYLYEGDFRVGDANWDNEWGYYGYRRQWFDVDYGRRGGDAPNIYGNISNFGEGERGGYRDETLRFIHCSQAGYYSLYLGSDGYLYIYNA